VLHLRLHFDPWAALEGRYLHVLVRTQASGRKRNGDLNLPFIDGRAIGDRLQVFGNQAETPQWANSTH
jgi:hypothetical protein